jgi:hypothetical protein
MERLLVEPLFYIYFIYGLSFLIMAYLVINEITKATSIALVSSFYMLAIFGLMHGTTELIDWLRFISKILGTSEFRFFTYASQILLVLSFVFLLQFGINLLTYKSEKKGLVRTIPTILFAIFIVVIFARGIDDILEIGLIGRYSFGFTGSAISAITLFILGNTMKPLGNQKLVRGLTIAAIGFACYAVFGGLIVKPVAGLPIQLYRAVCAMTIAISSYSALDVFKIE